MSADALRLPQMEGGEEGWREGGGEVEEEGGGGSGADESPLNPQRPSEAAGQRTPLASKKAQPTVHQLAKRSRLR